MKTIAFVFASILAFTKLFAQGIPVSQTVQPRNAVIEEYTGINCQYCPTGHRIANTIASSNPNRVVLINVHVGTYASPIGNQPNLQTDFGNALLSQTGLDGYPAATVNRHHFSFADAMAMGAGGAWTTASNEILNQNGSANLGVKAEIDVQSQLLTVEVEVYNTGNTASPNGKNRLTVVITQDNIIGPQIINSQVVPDPNLVLPDGQYIHNHVLRHVIEPPNTPSSFRAFGEEISGSIGALTSRTYSYVLPDYIKGIPVVLNQLKIAAFVAEGKQEIITGHAVSPVFTNFPGLHNSKVLDISMEDNTLCGFSAAPSVKIRNNGSTMLTSVLIDYSVNGSPVKTYNWTGSLSPVEETEIALPGINFFPDSANTVSLATRLPNGSQDAYVADDEMSFSFASAPDVSNTLYMTLRMDQYGDETTWEVINSSGTVLYSGGPYANLANAPAVLDTFDLPSGDCYKFKAYDNYGDGILGTGNKGFTIVDDQGISIVSNYRSYGSEGSLAFGVDAPQPDSSDVFSGIGALTLHDMISVYPNPASGNINIIFTASNLKDITVYITNTLGQILVTAPVTRAAGDYTLQLGAESLSPGIYFLNVIADGSKYSEKILIAR